MLTPLILFTTSIIATPAVSALEFNIFSVSVISSGQLDPTPIIERVGFATYFDKFGSLIYMGNTNLEYDYVAYVDFSHEFFNFLGSTNTGTIAVSAESSAFDSIAGHSSNSIEFVIAAPLLIPTLTFKVFAPMVVCEKDQIPIASSTSLLEVSIVSNTPYVCTNVFSRIHAVAAVTSSIKASPA